MKRCKIDKLLHFTEADINSMTALSPHLAFRSFFSIHFSKLNQCLVSIQVVKQ